MGLHAMIAVLQRVSSARVLVEGQQVGAIEAGLMILLGVHREDSEKDSSFLVEKTAVMRIFGDGAGKMNLSLLDVSGGALVVSQFTLLGDWRKGRRPSFTHAAGPVAGQRLYQHFIDELRAQGVAVESGQFGAMMEVQLTNDGPVTFVLNSRES